MFLYSLFQLYVLHTHYSFISDECLIFSSYCEMSSNEHRQVRISLRSTANKNFSGDIDVLLILQDNNGMLSPVYFEVSN